MPQEAIKIRKADGTLEPFDIIKLEHSLRHAHASPELTQKTLEHITEEIEDGMTTHDIYQRAFSLLHKLERPAAVRYSLRRAIMSLGPSGFPFEKFVAEIFRTQGYEAVTDQVVQGGCVSHEVDVIAWKGDELIMSEVKYHNELGMKSDLKVVLYVKARFDDLTKATFNYGGKERKLTQGWLITNTKFTLSALQYAECQNLKIVGWNYPANNSLRDMIERSGLIPITQLNSLSERDKKILMEKNILTCSAIDRNPSLLSSASFSQANSDAVLEEIRNLLQPLRSGEAIHE